MNLDDRLRQALERQHIDTEQRVTTAGGAGSFVPSPRRPTAPVIAAVAVLVVVAFGLYGLSQRDGTTTIDTGEPPPSGSSSTTTTTTTLAVPPPLLTTTIEPAPPSTEANGAPQQSTPQPTTSTASPTQPTSSPPTTTLPTTTLPTTESTPAPTTEQPAPTYSAIANPVCATGYRAPLERASLRYVGPNEGWNRLDDLVDEQDGPYYFEAWEPGYPDDVTVEITLDETVVATAVMVAQDPFTPRSGDIDIDSASFAGSIVISGTEGWRRLDLAAPTELSSFTIRRDAETEDIMEVLVCVVDPAP